MVKKSTVLLVSLLMAAAALAGDKDRDKEKEKKNSVDSGTFGIYLNGKRIGSEKFNIEQQAGQGIVTAELTIDDGTNKAEQSSELRVGSDGNIKLYKWRSTLPTKEESTIEPNQELLIEHLTTADQKKRDVPYILPISTVILDDYFFSQRELLIWRYLAAGCVRVPPPAPGQPVPPDSHLQCGPAHFGILVPHQHAPGGTVVELVGRDKITFKGTERELNKFKVDTDGVQWLIWVDDPETNYKVIKMSIPASNIEVWRE
jgi:hypothetical protein